MLAATFGDQLAHCGNSFKKQKLTPLQPKDPSAQRALLPLNRLRVIFQYTQQSLRFLSITARILPYYFRNHHAP